jgi:hypothetical protein
MSWIIELPGGHFLRHPRGEVTAQRAEAHSWRYKADAQRALDNDPDIKRCVADWLQRHFGTPTVQRAVPRR